MPETKTTWVSDVIGNKALVTDTDRWLPLGWSETSEPESGQKVWLRHETTGGIQLFDHDVVPQWKALGWQPSEPPEPVDLLHDDHLVDPGVAVDDTKSKPTKATASTTKKES